MNLYPCPNCNRSNDISAFTEYDLSEINCGSCGKRLDGSDTVVRATINKNDIEMLAKMKIGWEGDNRVISA